MSRRGILRVLAAVVLVAVVGAMLWFSSPVRALDIDIKDMVGTKLGKTIKFTVQVDITEATLLPIQSVDLRIYNGDDYDLADRKVTCPGLPLTDSEDWPYGDFLIDAVVDPDLDYGYGYGYLEWGGYTYSGWGYGYGAGPGTITYTVTWSSPRWSSGKYTIEALVTAATGEVISYTEEFSLTKSGGGGGGGGAAPDTTPPTIREISHSGITKTTVEIYWKTQELSTSQVEYWSNGHEFSELDETMVVNHHVTLTGLTPGTIYYYKTISVDAAGNKAESEILTFTTGGAPATFRVTSLEIAPGEVDIGDTVTVSVVVQNIGDAQGTYTVTLVVDGQAVATKQVTVPGDAEQVVTFTITAEEAGTYSVGVAELTGSFTVEPAGPTPTPTTAVPTPTPPPAKPPVNWWLIGGIIAGLVAVAMVVWLTVIRQRAVT